MAGETLEPQEADFKMTIQRPGKRPFEIFDQGAYLKARGIPTRGDYHDLDEVHLTMEGVDFVVVHKNGFFRHYTQEEVDAKISSAINGLDRKADAMDAAKREAQARLARFGGKSE